MSAHEVFISYRRVPESEKMATAVEQTLRDVHGFKVIRDSTAEEVSEYKGDIQALLNAIGKARLVVVILCDDYFYSRHCMFELVSLSEHADFRERIFPIMLPGTTIFEPAQRGKFMLHWEQKRDELNAILDQFKGHENLLELQREVTNYDNYRDSLDKILNMLAWMNHLTADKIAENQFRILADELSEAEKKPSVFFTEARKDGAPKIRDEFRYTTNRQDQWPTVSQRYSAAGKVSAFLLHGEKPQSHTGFVQRVKLEIEGHAFLNLKPDLKVVTRDFLFPDIPTNGKDFATEELLKILCDQLELNPDERTPLLNQRFGILLRQSKITSSLRGKDVILLQVRINFDQWENPACVEIIDWLTQSFFSDEGMDADAPKVLLFWSLLYNSRPVIKKRSVTQLSGEVQKLKNPPMVLQELMPVKSGDITQWLEKHAEDLSEEAIDRVWQEYFATPKDLDMKKVEDHLGEIIELINQNELE